MKYILDFDEVLFNTTALKAKMAELNIPESERGHDVFENIAKENPSFSVEALIFPNVLEFLKEHGKDCIIVSSASSDKEENNTDLEAQKAFQMKKIFLSGITEFVKDVRVVGVGKTEALTELQKECADDLLFLDDRETYIREAQKLGIKSIWMDRNGKGCTANKEGTPTMLEFPRVGNFAEFVALVESWKKE